MTGPAGSTLEASLGQADERQWARLRRQLKYADGFWLGFVFSSSPAAVYVLQRRTENVLRARARRQVLLAPRSPEDLVLESARVAETPTDDLGCVWLTSLAVDDIGSEGGAWETAWDRALLALNQARQPVRKRLGAGLVIAAPPAVKPRVREAAPDLSSVRALVVDLIGPEGKPPRDIEAQPLPALEASVQTRPGRSTGATPPPQEWLDLMRTADSLLAANRPLEAVEPAQSALAIVREARDASKIARTLGVLGDAESRGGDVGAAFDHIAEAIDIRRRIDGDERELILLLDRLARMARARGDLATAVTSYDESLAISRRRASGDDAEGLRDLSVSLNKVGDTQRATGDLSAAQAAYTESLTIRRRLLDTYGENPETLRDVSVSLNNVADTQRATGDLNAAQAAYTESLTIRRQLLDTYGENPQTLRDLSASLDNVAELRHDTGDDAAAAALDAEAASVAERLERLVETTNAAAPAD